MCLHREGMHFHPMRQKAVPVVPLQGRKAFPYPCGKRLFAVWLAFLPPIHPWAYIPILTHQKEKLQKFYFFYFSGIKDVELPILLSSGQDKAPTCPGRRKARCFEPKIRLNTYPPLFKIPCWALARRGIFSAGYTVPFGIIVGYPICFEAVKANSSHYHKTGFL